MNDFRRVFIGMPASAALQGEVQRYSLDFPDTAVRWIAPQYLHVTLVPPWRCLDIAPVCRRISAAASAYSPFTLDFQTVSPGPDKLHPRLFWAAGRASDLLFQLHGELADHFVPEKAEMLPFFLHMTIACLSTAARSRAETSPDVYRKTRTVAWKGMFDRIRLCESELRPSGARYRVLCDASFCGRKPS